MIVGDTQVFAIESGIATAYERLSLLGLGFFVVHVGGYRYGIHEPHATMLANSLAAIRSRIMSRGQHTAPFASEPEAARVATAFRQAFYADDQEDFYFGLPLNDFTGLFAFHDLVWAPDGNEAFDDGSYILQFDDGNRVRLIAFRSGQGGFPDLSTLRDVWMEADLFYETLDRWRAVFETEWANMPKRENQPAST